MIVFNGPFQGQTVSPVFMKSGLDLKGQGFFYGPPRQKPYRLLLGSFEAEGAVLTPHGRTYTLVYR